jgi:GNAT superfamily N-acetyltransferase
MTTMRFDDLGQYSDVLRARSGEAVTVRFVEPRDAEALQNYFRSLTTRSRYNRFLGASSELPPSLLEAFVHVGEADRFSVIATLRADGHELIVGEARYAFETETASIEFGLSIDDRWQGHGIGKALLKNLECRAASFGAGRLFGDTLRSNEAMIGLARKTGYRFMPSPGDWKLVRFEKNIDAEPPPAISRPLLTRVEQTGPVPAAPEPGRFVFTISSRLSRPRTPACASR